MENPLKPTEDLKVTSTHVENNNKHPPDNESDSRSVESVDKSYWRGKIIRCSYCRNIVSPNSLGRLHYLKHAFCCSECSDLFKCTNPTEYFPKSLKILCDKTEAKDQDHQTTTQSPYLAGVSMESSDLRTFLSYLYISCSFNFLTSILSSFDNEVFDSVDYEDTATGSRTANAQSGRSRVVRLVHPGTESRVPVSREHALVVILNLHRLITNRGYDADCREMLDQKGAIVESVGYLNRIGKRLLWLEKVKRKEIERRPESAESVFVYPGIGMEIDEFEKLAFADRMFVLLSTLAVYAYQESETYSPEIPKIERSKLFNSKMNTLLKDYFSTDSARAYNFENFLDDQQKGKYILSMDLVPSQSVGLSTFTGTTQVLDSTGTGMRNATITVEYLVETEKIKELTIGELIDTISNNIKTLPSYHLIGEEMTNTASFSANALVKSCGVGNHYLSFIVQKSQQQAPSKNIEDYDHYELIISTNDGQQGTKSINLYRSLSLGSTQQILYHDLTQALKSLLTLPEDLPDIEFKSTPVTAEDGRTVYTQLSLPDGFTVNWKNIENKDIRIRQEYEAREIIEEFGFVEKLDEKFSEGGELPQVIAFNLSASMPITAISSLLSAIPASSLLQSASPELASLEYALTAIKLVSPEGLEEVLINTQALSSLALNGDDKIKVFSSLRGECELGNDLISIQDIRGIYFELREVQNT